MKFAIFLKGSGDELFSSYNLGHDQQFLSSLLATLIMLAYLLRTLLDLMDDKFACFARRCLHVGACLMR